MGWTVQPGLGALELSAIPSAGGAFHPQLAPHHRPNSCIDGISLALAWPCIWEPCPGSCPYEPQKGVNW